MRVGSSAEDYYEARPYCINVHEVLSGVLRDTKFDVDAVMIEYLKTVRF